MCTNVSGRTDEWPERDFCLLGVAGFSGHRETFPVSHILGPELFFPMQSYAHQSQRINA